jgi:hypothetical protein
VTKGFRIAAAAVAATALVWTGASAALAASTSDLYVSPKGKDSAAGTESAPLRTLQAALNKATAGTTVHLGAGVYNEHVTTVRAGTAGHPIAIVGPESGKSRAGRYQAVLTTTTAGRALTIDHSWISVSGFTIDGQPGGTGGWPTTGRQANSFKKSVSRKTIDSKLIYIGYNGRNVNHVTVANMWLNGSGGECLRIRNASTSIEVRDSTIQWCGMYSKEITSFAYHNGEGVYVGTSPKSTSQPMHLKDTSGNVNVHGNVIRTFGSECFDAKENSHDNVFANNVCQFATEPLSNIGSIVELRGARTTVTGNEIGDAPGFGIKIAVDSNKYDNSGNVVRNNRVTATGGAAVTLKGSQKQGAVCGNQFRKSTSAAFALFGSACKG